MLTPVTCFIIMPFLPELERVRDILRDTVVQHGKGSAFRADDSFYPGALIDQIKEAIAKADFCIADVSGANPNVLWEAGYAHALGKPVIQISQETGNLPFDIRALRTIKYSLDELDRVGTGATAFHRAIEAAVDAVLQTLRGKARVLGSPHDELRNLAEQLDRQSIYKGRREPLLRIVLNALQWDRKHGPQYAWRATDTSRLADALFGVAEGSAQGAFWWLIVHGVFEYTQIDEFQRNGSDGVRENLPLVRLSDRGVHLLNQLQEPIF